MKKIAFVKLKYDDTTHRIPATDIKQEGGRLMVYDGEKIVGGFDLNRVEHWALELASD